METEATKSNAAAEVWAAVHARPFQPFWVLTTEGGRYRIAHPECAWVADGVWKLTPGPAGRETIEGVLVDPVPFGPITKRRAKRSEVETVIMLATLFDATPEDLRRVAKATGLSATWAALRLAGVEKLATFEAVERRARELAALRAVPGRIDMGWLAVVRVYGACVVATMAGECLATNAELGLVAGLSAGSVGAALKPLEAAGLIQRSFELGLVGPRKIRAVDFAVEPVLEEGRPF